jgi:hypothetical protein
MDQTIKKLRETPYLIVMDSLESGDAVVRNDERAKAECNELLQRLEGGKTLVVVVSSQQDCWLNDSVVKFGTYQLKSLEMFACSQLSYTSLLTKQ